MRQIFLITVFTLLLASICLAQAPNGGFEGPVVNGFPEGWGPVVFPDAGLFELTNEAHSGNWALHLRRTKPMLDTGEVGANSTRLCGVGATGFEQVKGALKFWYKAPIGPAENLKIYVIALNEKGLERPSMQRATFELPEAAVGDGQWHMGLVPFNWEGQETVATTIIAPRILWNTGELLLDDFELLKPEQAAGLPVIKKLELVESRVLPGLEATIKVTVKNAGFGSMQGATVGLTLPEGLMAEKTSAPLPALAPGEEAQVAITIRGLRERPGTIGVTASWQGLEAWSAVKLAPKLEVKRFTLSSLLIAPKESAWLALEIENTGNCMASGLGYKLKTPDSVKASYEAGKAGLLRPGEKTEVRWLVSGRKESTWDEVALTLSARDLQPVALTTPVVVQQSEYRQNDRNWLVFGNDKVRLLFPQSKAGCSAALFEVKRSNGPSAWRRLAVLPYLTRLVTGEPAAPERAIPYFTVESSSKSELVFSTEVTDSSGATWKPQVIFSLEADSDCISARWELSTSSSGKLLAFDGPILYVGSGTLGTQKRAAIFPGCEWLVAGEDSSNALDIKSDHPDRLRYVPHKRFITMPWMAVTNEAGTTGLLWDAYQKWDGRNNAPAAAFASPDRFGNVDGHLMGLFLPSVPDWIPLNERVASKPYLLTAGKTLSLEASLFGSSETEDPLVAQDRWISLYGLPEPLPPQQGDWYSQLSFMMKAYLDSLWIPEENQWWNSKGGGMMSVKGLYPNFVYYLRLGGLLAPDEETEQRAEALLAQVQEIAPMTPLAGDLGMTWDTPSGGITGYSVRASELVTVADDRGTWPYDGNRPGTGPFEDYDYNILGKTGEVEVGLAAYNTFEILRFIALSGDRSLLPFAERSLQFMKQFRVPRAAQVWEVPVHTPDILASSDAVDAYILGYELTGKQDYLDEARYWARTGLPFLYTWHEQDQPLMLYASIPVFGASQFTISWFGRPVQWNGLRYARAIQRLAEYDSSQPWGKIAEGIVVSATYQMHLEGEDIALWPDNIGLVKGDWCPWIFQPQMIIDPLMVLLERPIEPAYRVLPLGDYPMHVVASQKLLSARLEGDSVSVEVDLPEHQPGHVLLAQVARPGAVLVDGKQVTEHPLPLPEEGLYWTYVPGQSVVVVRLGVAGQHTVQVSGLVPRPILLTAARKTDLNFEFNEGMDGWLPQNGIGNLSIAEGALAIQVTNPDPYMARGNLEVAASDAKRLILRMKLKGPSPADYGQLYFSTKANIGFTEKAVVKFDVIPDGQWHEYILEVGAEPLWKGTITSLRLDPGQAAPATAWVDYLRVD